MTPLPVLDCDGCSACCQHMGGLPLMLVTEFADPEDTARLTPEVRAELQAAIVSSKLRPWPQDGVGACLWLDTQANRCTRYEMRPNVCREFPVGGEDCLEWRRERGIV